MPTEHSRLRYSRAIWSTSVLLPAPGAPVMPRTRAFPLCGNRVLSRSRDSGEPSSTALMPRARERASPSRMRPAHDSTDAATLTKALVHLAEGGCRRNNATEGTPQRLGRGVVKRGMVKRLVVEDNTHILFPVAWIGAFSDESQHGSNLFFGYAVEQIENIIRSVIDVLQDRRDRQSGALEDPGPAQLSGNTLQLRTLRPIHHFCALRASHHFFDPAQRLAIYFNPSRSGGRSPCAGSRWCPLRWCRASRRDKTFPPDSP